MKEVVAAVIENEGLVLCARRSNNTTLSGYLEFPGGKVEENESMEEVLIREIKEELQCDIKVGKKIHSSTHQGEEFDFLFHSFSCWIRGGEPTAPGA
ncbi:(deoxy)nucleoside triphosphate pyrophosphohydrolase [Thalassobacillus sp. C254]|uniref:(deoxy)nucleoside triphosphate pyrophosphohydrolase n=1 Tax=Thalassobacillus sp. C254 TaxID=1225341 RepID=UPI0006D09FA0|nr:NUDIX domain-containing protein [Thalassobacillus sp. C254]